MKKNYFKKIQLLSLLLITCVGYSQTDITVSEDSYVRGGGNGDINYNGKIIEVKESSSGNLDFSRHAFLKFDLSTFNAITSAVLHVHGNQSFGGSFDVSVFEVADDAWTESTLTWNNAPAISTVIGTFATPGDVDDLYQDFEIDITSYIKAQLAGDKIVSLVLTDASATNDTFRFLDKENTENGPAAYITIVGTTLGVEDEIKSRFTMFPNPTQDSFVIHSPNASISNVEIFSISGSMIFNNNNVSSNKLRIDTSSFQSGIYIVNVENEQGKLSVKKLIKL
ncbi:DNRLRE domain-containing protein [Formosa undariae]|uniref:DNRLRE domain-containing protein n=1 Tax=Formosa undariae TaxID=1325436 RepID=A0ABV5F474_9FLAO